MKNFDINQLWKNEKLPIINGVLFPDGTLINFSIEEGFERKIKCDGKSFIDLNNLLLASVDVFFQLDLPFGHLTCGEGSMGGDGFVCMEKGQAIEWVAFFENSNPFHKLSKENDFFIAENNLSELWKFSINGPSSVNIKISTPNKKQRHIK
ncbi:hypothetical protein ACFX58_16685 [Sphingomonas sp. NCPPB 2930]